MKEKNPVDNVRFYNRYDNAESFKIPQENVSLLIPSQFSERYIRVYVRNPDKMADAQDAFRNFMQRSGCHPSPAHSIPKVSPKISPDSVIPKKKLDFTLKEL
jgi:hypothetical protein